MTELRAWFNAAAARSVLAQIGKEKTRGNKRKEKAIMGGRGRTVD
jgi:hypothetical protein